VVEDLIVGSDALVGIYIYQKERGCSIVEALRLPFH